MKNINIETKREKTQQVKSQKEERSRSNFRRKTIVQINKYFFGQSYLQRNPISYNNRNRISLECTKYTIISRNFTVHDSFSDELVEEGAQQHRYLNRDRYTRVPYGFTSTMVYPWNTSETARLQNRPRTIVPLFNLFIFESRPCDSGRSLIVAYNRSRQIARRFALSFSTSLSSRF